MIGDISSVIVDARSNLYVKRNKLKGERVVLRIVGIATGGNIVKWNN